MTSRVHKSRSAGKCLSNVSTETFELSLKQNQIEKIENIAHLKKLKELNLANNFITKLENIDGLPALEVLNLWNNRIAEIGNIVDYEPIKYLALRGNLISDAELDKQMDHLRLLQRRKFFQLGDEDIPDILAGNYD